jgi:dynamin-binding protein
VVHPCRPPAVVSYFGFPFFTLVEGDRYQVLQEAGHPSIHPKLPLYVDDGEDCLLLCRNKVGGVGWALASFLQPISDLPS